MTNIFKWHTRFYKIKQIIEQYYKLQWIVYIFKFLKLQIITLKRTIQNISL